MSVCDVFLTCNKILNTEPDGGQMASKTRKLSSRTGDISLEIGNYTSKKGCILLSYSCVIKSLSRTPQAPNSRILGLLPRILQVLIF